jgi:hypothetical protein
MASDYPASIDAFPDPLVNSPLNSPSHAALHQDVNDAVEKIETKVGLGVSPASGASAGQVLMSSGSGNTGWSNVSPADIDSIGQPANAVLVSDGAGSGAWSSSASGLWRIESKTLTGSAVDFTGCFTSDYNIYKVFFYNVRASASGTDFGFRLLSGTSPAITNYNVQRTALQSTSDFNGNSTLTYGRVGFLGSNTTSPCNYESTIYNPNTAIYTTIVSTGSYMDDTNNLSWVENNSTVHKTATAYTGLRIYKDSGTFNGGTAVIFGVRT